METIANLMYLLIAFGGMGIIAGSIWMAAEATKVHGFAGIFCVIPLIAYIYGFLNWPQAKKPLVLMLTCAGVNVVALLAAAAIGERGEKQIEKEMELRVKKQIAMVQAQIDTLDLKLTEWDIEHDWAADSAKVLSGEGEIVRLKQVRSNYINIYYPGMATADSARVDSLIRLIDRQISIWESQEFSIADSLYLVAWWEQLRGREAETSLDSAFSKAARSIIAEYYWRSWADHKRKNYFEDRQRLQNKLEQKFELLNELKRKLEDAED